MSPQAKKFLGMFAATFMVLAALNVWTYFHTYQAPWSDGFARVGFPFTFRFWGGMPFTYWFSLKNFLGDIAVAVSAGVGAGLLLIKFWPTRPIKRV